MGGWEGRGGEAMGGRKEGEEGWKMTTGSEEEDREIPKKDKRKFCSRNYQKNVHVSGERSFHHQI